jgi:hypothetical protein
VTVEARHVCRALSIVVSAALVVALTAVTSAAITPGESFNVSPSQGAPFTVISVSGANCIGQPAAAELEDLTGDDLPGGTGVIPGANVIVFATPDGSGNWSGNIAVPPVVAAGQYRVVASCGPDAYAPQPFQVLAGELASMSVSPAQAPAGADVVVDVSGTLCRDPNAQADVGILAAGAQQADEFVARVFVTPDSAGNWSTQLTVPAATPAGNYLVAAQCVVANRQFFLYLPPPTIQLVLVVSPSFTG